MKTHQPKEPKPYTPAQLRAFDKLTLEVSSRDQMTRISARFAMKTFVAEHGEKVCDAMFEVLHKRDERKGTRR